ncbi:MAG: hypothetical protein ACYDH6_14795 [Acidimicrobiales bacterium]
MTEYERDLEYALPGGCGWCHRPLGQPRFGRRRKYCKHSCRQRAYEQRKLNRAVDWIAFGERRLDQSRVQFAHLTDTWVDQIHAKSASDNPLLGALWDDVMAARYPAAWQRPGARFLFHPPHPRPQHRYIGDRLPFGEAVRARRATAYAKMRWTLRLTGTLARQ